MYLARESGVWVLGSEILNELKFPIPQSSLLNYLLFSRMGAWMWGLVVTLASGNFALVCGDADR